MRASRSLSGRRDVRTLGKPRVGAPRGCPYSRAHPCATSDLSDTCVCATGQQQRRVGEFDTFPAEFSSAVCFYMTGCAPPTIPDHNPAKSKFHPDRPYSPSCSILRFTRVCALLTCAGLLRSGVGAWPTRRRASTSRVSGRGVARESACGSCDVAFVPLRHMTRLARSHAVPRPAPDRLAAIGDTPR